jgi:signal transduction histidine kinase
MIFDISHVMRRPVVTMKGLTNLIDMDIFDKEELKEITHKIKTVSNEMEEYIRAMFKIYEAKQDAIYHL